MVMAAPEPLDPPRTLGHITLLARLGEGGMAEVFLGAVGKGAFARLAAVKLLRPDSPDRDYRTRFLDEAKVVVKLHHNNLVDVRAAGEVDGQLYIAMEAIQGRDLADVWDRCAELKRAFPVPLAVHLTREILRGLHYAHTFPRLGLVHRDISPSNILIDWEGAIRLADFGLATSSLKGSMTAPGVVFGKVAYMCPEQAKGEVLDARADIYACGVVLWELLTGRPMRERDELNTDAVSRGEVPAPSTLSQRVDPAVDAIVMRALARDRERRFPDAAAMLNALSQWIARNAPETSQDSMAEFMGRLFGDTADRERSEREALLRRIVRSSRTQVFDGLALGRSLSGPVSVAASAPRSTTTSVVVPHSRTAAPPRRVTVDAPAVVDRLRIRPTSSGGGSGAESSTLAGRRTRALAAADELPLGTVVAQRYRVDARVGRGPVTTTYRGEHLHTGRRVAIKVLSRDSCGDETVAQRFRGEARAATACGHPNIIEMLDAGELDDGRLYLVTELLTGPSLRDEIARQGGFDVATACRVLAEVGRAVMAAHDAGVVHRDLTPDNVVLRESLGDGPVRLKVVDFGVSAWWGTGAKRLTLPGSTLGTPQYMAPEQALGREATPLFDIYALGVMAHEVLVGSPPFEGDNLTELTRNKHRLPAPSVGARRDGLPRRLVMLVDQCLKREPSQRPQTVAQLVSGFEGFVTTSTAPLSELDVAATDSRDASGASLDVEALFDSQAHVVAGLAPPVSVAAGDHPPAAAASAEPGENSATPTLVPTPPAPAVARRPTVIQTRLGGDIGAGQSGGRSVEPASVGRAPCGSRGRRGVAETIDGADEATQRVLVQAGNCRPVAATLDGADAGLQCELRAAKALSCEDALAVPRLQVGDSARSHRALSRASATATASFGAGVVPARRSPWVWLAAAGVLVVGVGLVIVSVPDREAGHGGSGVRPAAVVDERSDVAATDESVAGVEAGGPANVDCVDVRDRRRAAQRDGAPQTELELLERNEACWPDAVERQSLIMAAKQRAQRG